MQNDRTTRIACVVVAIVAIALVSQSALAAPAGTYVTVYGGPTYTPEVGGYVGAAVRVNEAGTAVGSALQFSAFGGEHGVRVLRWDGSVTTAIELDNLGMNADGYQYSIANAINNAGTAVGSAYKFDSSGTAKGERAVRWDASGPAATELGLVNVGTWTDGLTHSFALAINDAGTIVGYAHNISGSGEFMGSRAVRWDGSGSVATVLENLGTDSSGVTQSIASAVNNAGTAVGFANKFDGLGVSLGFRAVRWDGTGTAATELDNLGTDTNDHTESFAVAINHAGTAVGYAEKYTASGVDQGQRLVRWDASGSAATELGNLGTNKSGNPFSQASAINGTGTIVGWAQKFDGSGMSLGSRAVRWDGSGTATELENLGTNGFNESVATAINDAGIAVGSAIKNIGSGAPAVYKAVYWGLDGVAVDLNTLIDPASGWSLNEEVQSISNMGWIGGAGLFDPDGPGGYEPYRRMYLIQVSAAGVPEPATVALFGVGLVGLGLVLRRQNRLDTLQKKCVGRTTRICCAIAAVAAIMLTSAAPAAAYVTVYGGPTYTPGVGGFQFGVIEGVNNAGTVVANAPKYNSSDEFMDFRAIRWDGSGAAATELGNLGSYDSGRTKTFAYAINEAGSAVGYADNINGMGEFMGSRAVRWDGSGTAATELEYLGTDTKDYTESFAYAINDAGTAVGWAQNYDSSGAALFYRALRWDSSGTAATRLDILSREPNDYAESFAVAINDKGTAVGYATSVGFHGDRTVRWDASGTAATELGNIGTSTSDFTNSFPVAMNEAGTVVGYADHYDGSGQYQGQRPIRWEGSGTTAIELGNLGVNADGTPSSRVYAISEAGTAVGWSWKYDGSHAFLGVHAVRWDGAGTAATELDNLGTVPSGVFNSEAWAVNDAGVAVGYSGEYPLGNNKAVYWGPDGLAIDLNTLIDPASGWSLKSAQAISDTGWIGGRGTFDPDGPGGQNPYERLFLMHVPAAAVPEPATVALFGVGLVGFGLASDRRGRRNVVTTGNLVKRRCR